MGKFKDLSIVLAWLVAIGTLLWYVGAKTPSVRVEKVEEVETVTVFARKVADEDMTSLLVCAAENACQIPSSKVSVRGIVFLFMEVVASDGTEVRYYLHNDRLMIMLTRDGWPVIIQDQGYAGVVQSATMTSTDGPHNMKLGDPEFDRVFPLLQYLYFQAMEQAKLSIIPPKKHDGNTAKTRMSQTATNRTVGRRFTIFTPKRSINRSDGQVLDF